MRTKLFIIALLSVVTMSAYAQTFTPANADGAIQSQQIMQTGAAYNGTVYEPFSSTTPSEQNAPGASYSPAKAPGGPRKGFDIGGDAGQGPSPIGDAVLPLMLLLGVYCGIRFIRRNKQTNGLKS